MKELVDIKAPLLTSTEYGKDVNQVMQNIDDNFKILSNRDFVKGDKGNSVRIQTVELSSNPTLLNELKLAVSSQYSSNQRQPKTIDGKSVMDWFKNPGSITLVYETIDGVDNIISSMPYVFKDLRFQNLANATNKQDYDNETDYSCVIYYDQTEFKFVQEFPTLYYDPVLGDFSWKINGVETGLEAMGPQGPAGKDGVFKIVIVDNNAISPDTYLISKIMYGSTFIDATAGAIEITTENGSIILEDHAEICKYYGITPGISVMVLKPEFEDTINYINNTYISDVYEEESTGTMSKQMVVHCSEYNKICEVEPISNADIDSLCEQILGSIV